MTLYCRGGASWPSPSRPCAATAPRMPSVPLRHGPWWTAVLMALPPKWHCATPVSPGWHGRTAGTTTSSPAPSRPRSSTGLRGYVFLLEVAGPVPADRRAPHRRTGERGNCSCAARYLSLLNNGYRTTCGQPWRLLARPGTTTNRTRPSGGWARHSNWRTGSTTSDPEFRF